MKRTDTDRLFTWLFRAAALASVLALGAILVFVFFQGSIPFAKATAPGIRLVAQRINDITVNGTQYIDHATFIELPEQTADIVISFSGSDGEEHRLDIAVSKNEKDPEKMLEFSGASGGSHSYPEAYVHTISWPGGFGGAQRIHILLPEPPYPVLKFLFGLEWQPSRAKVFGIFPMIAGTIITSLGAILLGVPAAIFCALFMAEFLPPKPAAIARAGIELLAGIPSVVYGFFGLMVIVPAVKNLFGIPAGNTMLSAIIVLALMILPTVITVGETALRAVPLSVREASLSLGAGKMQTAWRVVLPHAKSGVIAAVILGISRAVGETMAVILVAGNSPQLVKSPLESVRTLTATIAMEMGYASGRHSEMLFSIGVVLFALILALNSLILHFRRRMEEA